MGVKHVSSITDTFKRLNQNMHGDDPDEYTLPENQELAAQYLLLYEMSLPYGLDLNNKINLDKSGTRMTIMLDGITSGDAVRIKYSILDWFKQEAPSVRAVVTGTVPLMHEMSYVFMIPKMMQGAIIAILMVSLVLFFALRSWKLGLLGMMANIVPIMIGFGLWGAVYGIVNFAVMSVAGVCLGVVVDFAVHFLNKYRQGCAQGASAEDGVRYAFNKVAGPLWITMIVLASGFWVLTLNPFNFVANLGHLTSVIIVLALIFDLLMLPAILLTFNKFFYLSSDK